MTTKLANWPTAVYRMANDGFPKKVIFIADQATSGKGEKSR